MSEKKNNIDNKMRRRKTRDVKFRGKKRRVKTNDRGRFSKRFNLPEVKTNELLEEKEDINRIIIDTDGKFRRINLRDNNRPLLLRQFGISRISNSKLFGGKVRSRTGRKDIVKEIPSDKKIKVKVDISIRFSFSQTINAHREIQEIFTTTPRRLQDDIVYHTHQFLDSISTTIVSEQEREDLELEGDDWDIIDWVVLNEINQVFELEDMKLKRLLSLNVQNLFNEKIDMNLGGDCVRDYLSSRFKRSSSKKIKELGDENGVSVKEIYDWCVDQKISMTAYDIGGNVIKSFRPLKRERQHRALNFLAYNNHLYPVKSRFLNKSRYKKDFKYELVDNADDKLKEFLSNNILPTNVITKFKGSKSKDFIGSFTVDEVVYTENKELDRCIEILKLFGIEDKAYPSLTLNHMGSIFERLYLKNDSNSFMPNARKFVKSGFCYQVITEGEEDTSKYKTIDKNKCYASTLKSLFFLIKLDYRTALSKKYEGEDIVEHFLYIVKPKYSSVLLPDTNLYSGEHIIFCQKEKLDFEIIEFIECDKVVNEYRKLIDDLYSKVSQEEFKAIINVMIGKFSRTKQMRDYSNVDRICNKDELDCVTGFKKKIEGTDYWINETSTRKYDLYNKKPVSIQIHDASRRELYETMGFAVKNSNKIVNVRTDSFTWIGTTNSINPLLDENDMDCWKVGEYKPYENEIIPKNKPLLDLSIEFENDNYIEEGYGGCGKSHKLIYYVIPKFGEDYLALAPTNDALKEYRQKGFNCQVIQYYRFNPDEIPKEKHIIVDEIGMVDRYGHDFLYKCMLEGKILHLVGDFKQLPPFGEPRPFNSQKYIEGFFNKIEYNTNNYRNNFTIDYYDKMIYGELGKEQVYKHCVKNWEDADMIICYRNKTVDKYNNMKLEQLGFNSPYEVGVSVIARSNYYKDKGIYNKFTFTITAISEKDNIVILDDEFLLPLKGFKNPKNFKPSYARTSHGVQCKSIEKFFYAPEDDMFLNDPNLIYTIVSRLKTDTCRSLKK